MFTLRVALNSNEQAIFNPEGELSLIGFAHPGLAFAGPHRDSESGLCYNNFRFYDPTGEYYVSPDPIGRLGGDNNYGYMPNLNTWVGPFGLAGCKNEIYYRTMNPDGFTHLQKTGRLRIFNSGIDEETKIMEVF
ncbi:RHS repeat-associated core domain-containing protein [Pectobacterium sp. B1J-3]|uniref:RHS repeat-associated core domain-containing protein n=1 Tax=Pectobacterium sp. B1J-3 TaxID=3385371 RepID=UPI0039064A1E